MLIVVVAALVGAGYGLGRWGAPRLSSNGEVAPDAPAMAASSGAGDPDRVEPLRDLEPFASLPGDPSPAGSPGADAPPASARPSGAAGRNAPTVAIVIDDLGRSVEMLDELRDLGVPLTYAVLPFEVRTAEVAARLAELGEEFLCHLPMEARHGVDAGPGALHGAMDEAEIRDATRRALAAVPGAAGVNNHMGSSLSEDGVAMAAMLDVVGAAELFFLDSRTSAGSVAYTLAHERGLPTAERKVFLDGDRESGAIRREFRRLLELAATGTPAIAIGHPYPETLAILAEEIPRAAAAGYRFVTVSQVIAGREP